jgi:hypothetical protein
LRGIGNKTLSWSCRLTWSYLSFQIPPFQNKCSSYISRSQTILGSSELLLCHAGGRVFHSGAYAACVMVLAWPSPTQGSVLSPDRKTMCFHQTGLPMKAVAWTSYRNGMELEHDGAGGCPTGTAEASSSSRIFFTRNKSTYAWSLCEQLVKWLELFKSVSCQDHHIPFFKKLLKSPN